jgi:ribonuclease D
MLFPQPISTAAPVYIQTPEDLIAALTTTLVKGCYLISYQIALDTETSGDDPHQDTAFTLQVIVPEVTPAVIDLRTALDNRSHQVLNQFLAQPDVVKVFQNGKFDLKVLQSLGIEVPPPYFDTLLVGQILGRVLKL